MKALISSLFFDKELVNEIKDSRVPSEILYYNLMAGKITLSEYLAATK